MSRYNSEKLHELVEDSTTLHDLYMKHLSAMTGEKLHSKADIAVELAYRDMRLNAITDDAHRLVKKNRALKAMLRELQAAVGEYQTGILAAVNTPEHLNKLLREVTKL